MCVCVSHAIMSNSLPPHGLYLPGSSVHGILQARILEWVAITFSRGSSWPRDWTQVSLIAGRLFTIWTNREALKLPLDSSKNIHLTPFHSEEPWALQKAPGDSCTLSSLPRRPKTSLLTTVNTQFHLSCGKDAPMAHLQSHDGLFCYPVHEDAGFPRHTSKFSCGSGWRLSVGGFQERKRNMQQMTLPCKAMK